VGGAEEKIGKTRRGCLHANPAIRLRKRRDREYISREVGGGLRSDRIVKRKLFYTWGEVEVKLVRNRKTKFVVGVVGWWGRAGPAHSSDKGKKTEWGVTKGTPSASSLKGKTTKWVFVKRPAKHTRRSKLKRRQIECICTGKESKGNEQGGRRPKRT